MPEYANSVMLVRPITIIPARRNRATAGASRSAGAESSSAREPARVTCPLMSNRSLIETGIPAKRDGAAFALRKRSIASAASSAASLSTRMKVRCPSPAGSAILARQSSTNWRAEIRPASRSSASTARVGFGMIVFFDYLLSFDRVMSRSSSAELNDLPCASSASDRVTPPPNVLLITKLSAPMLGSS